MRAYTLLVLFFASALTLSARAQNVAAVPDPTVVSASRVNTSQPLRSMDIATGLYRQVPYVVPNKLHLFGKRQMEAAPAGFIDSVLDLGLGTPQKRAGQGTTLVSFEGTYSAQNAPPDPSGDIGPNHYVHMINSFTSIFDKSGNVLMGPVPNNTFWQGLGGQCEVKNDGDPIVVYDEYADRWLVSQFALNPYAFCVAISATADPTGAYHQYEFPWVEFLDYPKVGVWPNGYYVTTNTFSAANSSFLYAEAVVLERNEMLDGDPAQSIRFQFPGGVGGLQPADADGAAAPGANAPGLFTGINFYAGTATGREQIQLFSLAPDWVTPANSVFATLPSVVTAPFARLTNRIPQGGTANELDNLADRLMYRTQYRDMGTHETMMVSHAVDAAGGRAGMRWYELRNTGTGWTMYQQGTYAPNDGVSRWMGSIAMNDNGDIALAYSASSGTEFPSIRFTGQTAASSGSGLMDVAETILHSGLGSQTSGNRWGDYSQLAVDATDGVTFWFTEEYSDGGTQFVSKSRINQFSITEIDSPTLAYSPGSLLFSLDTGDTDSKVVTFSNTAAPGAASLTINASLGNFTPLAPEGGDGTIVMAKPLPFTPEAPQVGAAAGTEAPSQAQLTGEPALAIPTGPIRTTPELSQEAGKAAVNCTDGQQTVGVTANVAYTVNSGALELGQSFTAPCTGFLQSIAPRLQVISGDAGLTWTATMRVYNGAGTLGTSLNASAFSVTNPAAPTTVFYATVALSAPVEITEGQVYTWFMDLTTGRSQMRANNANTYAGGQLYVTSNGNPASAGANTANDLEYLLTLNAPDVWATITPDNLTIAPGASATIDVDVDATGFAAGTYMSTLSFTTNDPDTPSGSIPVTLIVGGDAMAESIDGDAGWRLFAPAAPGMTVADLGDLNRLSGIPGYDATSGNPNILTDYNGASYFAPTGGAEVLTSGEGFWWYLYDVNCYNDGVYDAATAPNSCPGGDVNPSYALPFTLGTDKTPTTSDVTVNLHADNTKTNMLGNPFGQSLDISGISGWTGASNLFSPAAVSYDSGTNSWNYSTDPDFDVISAWQGFFVYGQTAGTLTIPETARSAEDVPLRKTDDRVFLAFRLTEQTDAAQPLADNGTILYFDENASAGKDAYDLPELRPADARHVSLAFGAENASGATVLRGHEGRSPNGGAFEIPLHVNAVGTSSTLDLTWPSIDRIPQDWSVKLRDLQTGATIDLRDQSVYTFEVESGVVSAADVFATPDASGDVASLNASEAAVRFVLSVTLAIATSTETGDGAVLSLASPMPNPARERATLRFSLATAGEATVAVYDVQGREVARLAEGLHASGDHAVIWNTNAVAAGVYVVRLATDDQVLTRRAVVVR